ncbi:MAG TPA: peptidoglycan DD-metalloendopeptidase family protein [Syntrophorhabdaceae bacterium]|nr:peptidoglycan DD-metalloendopeptidase family protein [Syntrophorhabdaceae bacterium]
MKRSHAAYGMMVLAVVVCLVFLASPGRDTRKPVFGDDAPKNLRKVSGTVRKGDVLSRLFQRNNLHVADLSRVKEAADGVYDLGKLSSGRPYSMTIDTDDRLNSLTYWIDDDTYLSLSRDGESLTAAIEKVEYDKRQLSFSGIIEDNLVASLGPGRDAVLLALDLSDIFAWDIDFNTDLRKGDTFRIVVEGLFSGNTFRKFGDILSAEFINDGQRYLAYRYDVKGHAGYYDVEGRPLKRAFLKAPLNFRRISSYYSGRRLHPILKVYRPHKGIDYVAAAGTPVSALGDGVVHFAGCRGGYGRLVIIRHRNGYSTWYGHLSRITKGIRSGSRVAQGDIIGRVGSTGLATGPHLHFEMRVAGRAVNPLAIRSVRAEPLGAGHRTRFRKYVASMERRLAEAMPLTGTSIPSMLASVERE